LKGLFLAVKNGSFEKINVSPSLQEIENTENSKISITSTSVDITVCFLVEWKLIYVLFHHQHAHLTEPSK